MAAMGDFPYARRSPQKESRLPTLPETSPSNPWHASVPALAGAVALTLFLPRPVGIALLLGLIAAGAYRRSAHLRSAGGTPDLSRYAGEQLEELRRQARLLERSLLGRIESSSLGESDTQKLKGCYRAVREVVQAPHPRTRAEMEGLLKSLNKAVGDGHAALDGHQPSQRLSVRTV